MAVVADVATTPVLYHLHTDHLNRPIAMTDGAKQEVWRANYLPFGAVSSITGTASLDMRFPGQWFQLETGFHHNWHRTYDPTTGRYLQPDPLGMPDGPSRWAYARSAPTMYVDPTGEWAQFIPYALKAARTAWVTYNLYRWASGDDNYCEGNMYVLEPFSASRFDSDFFAAANRLGFDPNDVTIQNGIAHLPITYTQGITVRDVRTIENALRAQGASSVQVDSGPIINLRLQQMLERRATEGRNHQGFEVIRTGNPDNMFVLRRRF